MHPDYAALCGISQDEMLDQMQPDIDILAQKLGISPDEAIAKLKEMYDGYHFCWPSPDIYNPYSLLRAFSEGKTDSFWFGSGTPTFLLEMLRKFEMPPSKLGQPLHAYEETFDAPTNSITSIAALLYQSGYMTITDADTELKMYTLGIPNKEVRLGLMRSLAPYYLTPDPLGTAEALIEMTRCLRDDDMDGCMKTLQQFLSTIPYCDNTDYEGHYQQVLYIIFSLLGAYADVEVRTAKGRIDIVLRTPKTLYLIELKMNKDADAAMSQIDSRDYASRFALGKLPMVKVGINFDTEKRNITDWKIEPSSHVL